MAYDKAIDSTYLNLGLSEIADKIREKGGTTDMLTFPDGFVTAIDAIEGGGTTTKLMKYSVDTASVITGSSYSGSFVGTYSSLVYGKVGSWNASGDVNVVAPADIEFAKGNYNTTHIASNELWYIKDYVFTGYSITYDVYDLTKLESASKTLIGEATEDYPSGTYVFDGGNIYYFSEESNCCTVRIYGDYDNYNSYCGIWDGGEIKPTSGTTYNEIKSIARTESLYIVASATATANEKYGLITLNGQMVHNTTGSYKLELANYTDVTIVFTIQYDGKFWGCTIIAK